MFSIREALENGGWSFTEGGTIKLSQQERDQKASGSMPPVPPPPSNLPKKGWGSVKVIQKPFVSEGTVKLGAKIKNNEDEETVCKCVSID